MSDPCTCPSIECGEHRYTLAVTAERDLQSGAETVHLSAPDSIDVLVYPCSAHPDQWISKVCIAAIDVITGEVGHFGSEWQHDHKPTKAEIARQVAQMLEHEVLEQLGCDPHGVSAK